MEKRSIYTIRTLLEELKEKTPKFEINQIFETLKSIYPDSKINKENKNIVLEGKEFTKPLVLNRKSKNNLLKENNPMTSFFRNFSRGDFLKVVEVKNKEAKCINISLKEKIRKKYYSNEETKYIILTFNDIANGNVKIMKRKVDKYLK